MKEIQTSGTWSSALSTEEFAAIRSAGFEPVGQVLGAAVYNIGFSGGYNCPGAWSGFGSYAQAYRSVTQVSGRGGYGSFGPLTQAMYDARHLAINRMVTECAELGGHGIVGVSLTIGSFPAGGLEFKAIGTAVRSAGAPPLKQPFSSDLSGQDFAKLLASGWVPAGLALGISVGARHDDWLTVGQTRWGAGNAEVVGYTELVNDTRHDARHEAGRRCGSRDRRHRRARKHRGVTIARTIGQEDDRMARFAWLFWGVLAMAAMVACRTNESPEAQVDDMKITAQVKEKIASDLGVSTVTNVSVNSTNGVVTLSGQVKTAENKSRAGEVAGGVPKVVRVINVLQVAPQP